MSRGKLTNKDEFLLLNGIYTNIPLNYLAQIIGVSEVAINLRYKKLKGTEKEKAFLQYWQVQDEYSKKLFDYAIEDSNIKPAIPSNSEIGIEKIIELFNLTQEQIKEVEKKIDDLSYLCLFVYRKVRKTG